MQINDVVENFTLQNQDEETVNLTDFADKPVVLFFYPRANTSGCTIEACGFRDAFQKLQEAGVVVLGVSRDTGSGQRLLHIFPKVKPENHAEEVLEILHLAPTHA